MQPIAILLLTTIHILFLLMMKAVSQYNTAISGLGDLTVRMDRIWKVDKTNWADADVTFKLTGGNDNIYMVVSASDAVFDGSDAVYQMDAAGNVTIPTDQIPDGAYFTFGKPLRGQHL